MRSGKIVEINATLTASIILREEILELLRPEASFLVISVAIATVFAFVYVVQIYPKPQIREVAASR